MNIAVLVSGGVDSAVSLRLLQAAGHTVTPFYLKIWLEDELSYLGNCPWEEDLAFAQAVCAQANLTLQVVSLQKEYHEKIVSYTISEVKAGRTPNPDVLCNNFIKFGVFMEYFGNSFDYVATGHYAQVDHQPHISTLKISPDPIKDQTYFLSHLKQEQLQKALFPIGHLRKSDVRALAQQLDLPNKDRKDSQGICFLGAIKFKDFVKHHLGTKQGRLIEFETNKVVGTHEGFWFYTIGQRQGIGLGGGPWYVVKKDTAENSVYISKGYYTPDKERSQFFVTDCNWITSYHPLDGARLSVKLRHGQQYHTMTLYKIGVDTFQIELEKNDQGIAAGQFAVFYDKDICWGSGIIIAPHHTAGYNLKKE